MADLSNAKIKALYIALDNALFYCETIEERQKFWSFYTDQIELEKVRYNCYLELESVNECVYA